MSDIDIYELGPIDYAVIEFPDRRPDGSALPLLRDLVDRGIVRVLDLAFIRKDADGSIVGVDIADVSLQGDIDGMLFAAASSGLVGGDGLEEVGRLVHSAHLPMDDMRERLEAAVDDRPIIEL